MEKYLLLIDGSWVEANLSEEDVVNINNDINSMSSVGYNVKLVTGEIIDVGIVDDIKKCNFNRKEVELHLSEEEFATIKKCMEFYLENWEDIDEDNEYRLSDGTILKTEEEFDKHFAEIPSFRKEYIIDEDAILQIEVDNCIEMGHHGFINNTLYTGSGELLVHNICKYELDDMFKGFGFSNIENIHNDNEIFEITDLGEEKLSKTVYVVRFKMI